MTQSDIDRLINMINLAKDDRNPLYIISQKRGDKNWYLFDIDDRKSTRQITWTKSKKAAIQFTSEIDVISIEEKYLKSYPTEIIQRRAGK